MKKIAGHMANYKPIIFALLITFIALLFVQWIVSPMDVSANSSTNSLEKDTPPIPTDIKFDHLTSEDGLDEDFEMI